MFNVFDGHGTNGHACARYAKEHLPRLAEKHIKRERVRKYQQDLKQQGKLKGAKLFDPTMWPQLSPEEYKECYRKAFLDCNKDMQQSTKVSFVLLSCFAKVNGDPNKVWTHNHDRTHDRWTQI